jgi:hypothetical protein
MSVVVRLDDPPTRAPNQFAAALIAASDARPSDKVMIVGVGQLDLLIDFVRRGFVDVSCQSAAFGLSPATRDTDVLIAPAMHTEFEFSSVLRRLGRALRPRGVLVAQVSEPLSHDECHLRHLFMEAGFIAIEQCTEHEPIGQLWCAHKRAGGLAKAA